MELHYYIGYLAETNFGQAIPGNAVLTFLLSRETGTILRWKAAS